ncbi:MAG TPA: hypothetical protein VGE15_08445 [Sphingobacteriaceae bacterium]
MLKRSSNVLFLFLMVWFSACSSAVDPEELYGSWKYVKVVTPSAPEEDLDAEALAAESASIMFTRSDSLIIWWGGKRLSRGKFRMEGNLIRYREDLEGGTTREFPFRVNSLNDRKLVFQTMSQQGTIVTAVRQK